MSENLAPKLEPVDHRKSAIWSRSPVRLLATVSPFFIVASVVYFVIVLPLNHLMARLNKPAPEAPSSLKTCPECLSEIPQAAKRCAHCAQPVV